MVDFFTGLFSCACFFSVCYLSVLLIRFKAAGLKRNRAPYESENAKSNFENEPRKESETVTHLYKIVTPKKRKARKSNVISLKGALMPPGTSVSYDGKLYTAKPLKSRNVRKARREDDCKNPPQDTPKKAFSKGQSSRSSVLSATKKSSPETNKMRSAVVSSKKR